jgi:hypothetical protein
VPPVELDRVERILLLHLLAHHGQQVRFEASQWVTEFGIVRQFSTEPPERLRRALRALEMGRLVYQRTQYVVGYSEPKHVFSLTPSGHRKALEVREAGGAGDGPAAAPEGLGGDGDGTGPTGREPPEPHGSAGPAVSG